MAGKPAVRITANLYRSLAVRTVEALMAAGVRDMSINAGRAPVVEDRPGLFGLFPHSVLADDPTEILTLVVDPAAEHSALELIIKHGQLEMPGRGSVFSESVELRSHHPLCGENTVTAAADVKAVLHENIVGICCIVQRGAGDSIAQVALDTGTSVPAVTYGNGTGVRDKMGILRITIPAEKELITVPANSFDADLLMDRMINVGKLDQPGRGFIYQFPLRTGVLNLRVSRGIQKHAASMEQIIAALDEVKGSSEWRKRAGIETGSDPGGRRYLTGLVELSLTVNEGQGIRLVEEAMNRGVGGATISRVRHVRASRDAEGIPPARESCTMIVSEKIVDDVVAGLDGAGAFSDKAHGQVLIRRVLRAFTYLAPS